MESIPHSFLKKHGIHPPSHGIHLEKVWSPSPIPWKRYDIHLESPWNPSTIPWKKYGIHPPFHGVHPHSMESTPHSMHSIWNNLGRVKYCNLEAFITNYWKPITPFLPKLIEIIYPQAVGVTGPTTCRSFNKVLTAARDHCKTLQEVTSNYAAFVTKKCKGSTRDHRKAKQLHLPQKDTVNAPRHSSCSSRCVSSCRDHQASGPAD